MGDEAPGEEAPCIFLQDFGDVAVGVGVVGEVVGSGVGSAVFLHAEQASDAARALEAPGEVESPGVGLEEGLAAGGVVNGHKVAECSPKGRPPIRYCGRKQGLRHLRAAAGVEAVADVIKGVRSDWLTNVRSNWAAAVRRIPPAVAVGTDDAMLAEHARHKPCIH